MPCLLCPQPRAASAPTCSARAERDYQVRSWHKGILADTSTPASRQGRASRSSVMWSSTYPGIALQVPSKLGSARAKADRRATDSSCAASAQGAQRQSAFAVRAPAKPQTPHIRDGTSSPTQRGPCGRVRGQVVAVPCCVCRKVKALPWLHRAGQQRAMAPHGRRLCCNSQARTAQHAAHSQSQGPVRVLTPAHATSGAGLPTMMEIGSMFCFCGEEFCFLRGGHLAWNLVHLLRLIVVVGGVFLVNCVRGIELFKAVIRLILPAHRTSSKPFFLTRFVFAGTAPDRN